MNGDVFSGVFEYGRFMTVRSDEAPEGRSGRGFIQPVSLADTENVRKSAMPGTVSRAKYLLIAPTELMRPEETKVTVSCDGVEYELLRLEPMGGAALTHWEGIIRMKGRA